MMSPLCVLILILAAAAPASAAPGDFDTTFGSNGVFVGAGGTPMDEIHEVHRLDDGSLIVLAEGQRFGGYGGVLAKLRPDGEYDMSFGWDGHAPTIPPSKASLFVRPEGRILVAGVLDQGGPVVVERFLPNGDLDSSFGADGSVEVDPWRLDRSEEDFSYYSGDAALDRRGRIVVAVARSAGLENSFLGLVRLTPRGRLDRSFGKGGGVRSAPRGPLVWAAARNLLIEPNGGLVVAGAMTEDSYWSDTYPTLARFRPGGRSDKRFGRRGLVRLSRREGQTAFDRVVRLPDGRLLAAEAEQVERLRPYEDVLWAVRRFRRGGALDRSFGKRGVARGRLPVEPNDHPEESKLALELIQQPDGKLLLTGTHRYGYRFGTSSGVGIARIRASGVLDREFGDAGVMAPALGARARTMYDSASAFDEVNAVLVLPDERILLGGGVMREPPGHPAGLEPEYMLARLSDSVAPRPSRALPRSIKFSRGRARVTVGCRDASGGCWARLRLGRFANELVHLGSGKATRVKVELSDQHRRALARLRQVKVRATLRLRDDNGNSSTTRRSVTLIRR